MRWNFHVSPSRTIVWPALLPPWKRMTMSARSASRSTTLPFPSSPHWAPTMTMPGMCRKCLRRRSAARPRRRAGQRAHLLEPRDGALLDLLDEGVPLEVRRDDHRALVLVARVDDRVELLEHPVARALGADVVDVEQVDGGEAVEEVDVGALAVGLERRADLGEQARQRVDRHAPAGVERRARDEHRERRLAGADAAVEPQAAAGVEVRVDVADEAPDDLDLRGGHVRHRRAVERAAASSLRGITALRLRARWRSMRPGRQRHGCATRVASSTTKPVPSQRPNGQVSASGAHAARWRPRNRGYSFWNVSGTSPSPPLRCLAMMSSASPGRSVVSGL